MRSPTTFPPPWSLLGCCCCSLRMPISPPPHFFSPFHFLPSFLPSFRFSSLSSSSCLSKPQQSRLLFLSSSSPSSSPSSFAVSAAVSLPPLVTSSSPSFLRCKHSVVEAAADVDKSSRGIVVAVAVMLVGGSQGKLAKAGPNLGNGSTT